MRCYYALRKSRREGKKTSPSPILGASKPPVAVVLTFKPINHLTEPVNTKLDCTSEVQKQFSLHFAFTL